MRKFCAALFVVGLLTACTETVSDSEEEKVQQLVNKLDYKKSKKSKPNTEKLFKSWVKQKNQIVPPSQKPPKTRKKTSELIGLTPDKVIATLGPPNFIRRDPPSEFWRYQNASCKLVIFFLGSQNKVKVTYAKTKLIRDNSNLDNLGCLKLIEQTSN